MENTGLGGVTVKLSGMADAQTATDNSGQFAFTGLRAGTYSVEISGFDMDEVGFGSTSSAATIGVGESKVISFDGTYLRTAGIMGQVSVEGVGLAGVTVTMTGGGEDMTDVTDAGGLYAFSKLKAGDYSVAISGYDTDDYEFATTSASVTVATGETANIPFEGTLLRTSGISGRVSVEGTGLDGVEVALAGAAEATAMTSNGGQYSFAGLAEGTYVVSMENPDANAYAFETVSHTVALGDSESAIRNFDGTHTRTASISGVLFIDEVLQDKMHTAGEPTIVEALAPLVAHGLLDQAMVAGLLTNAKVIVRGPSLNDPPMEIAINADGTFTTGEALVAGSYQVELPANNDMVAAALMAAGVEFVGESDVVMVDAGGEATFNFPFRITMQTIGVGAVMGDAEMVSDPPLPVAGVTLALFPTAQDAEAGTNELGKLPVPTMTGETGMTAFQYARADDTSPGSEDTDNIVFVKVLDAGHEDLMVSDGNVIEVQYPGVSRVHAAPTTVRFQNVAVNFQFWIKNDADARGGDVLVDGWHTQVFMGDSEDPLMVPDPDDESDEPMMVNLTMPSESAKDKDGMQGRVMVSYRVTQDQLPATFSAALRPDSDDWQQPMAMGETWEAVGDGLTYTHTGFELPKYNTHEVNDLNLNPRFGQAPARVTFTTQKLTVGVYRETDDEPGFTNYQSKVAGGDQRPHKDVAAEMSVSVMVDAAGRRGLEVYDEWDHDRDPDTDPIDATITGLTGGMATFVNLPAGMDFTVQLNEGSDRVAVGGPDSRSDRVQAYGGDLDLGMSVGAFGDDSGAGPEVRLCPLSSSSEDDMCSTFAYQWTSASADGKVTRRGAGVASATVNLEAITDNHSPDESTKTSKAAATKGNYSFSGVQDGEYWVRTPATADNKADSARVALYHDESKDDDADDGITGNPASSTANFDVTALRLEIKGFVANDGQEGDNEDPDLDQIVRGDEAVAGIELELLTITKVSTNQKDTTFKVHQTTETDDDGSYAFGDVVEGSAYYVRATGTGEYHAAEASAMDGFSRKVAADEYPAVEEGDFKLPYWDYNEGMTVNTSVTVSNTSGTVSASFVNFALLYVDGSISGRVREASGNPGNITIELIRCDTYDADDAECATYDRDAFPTETTETANSGSWEFNDLLEGWYEVYVGEAGYLAANIDDKNKIDDDGATESADMHTGLVKGSRDLAAGNNFYLYDNGLSDDDDLDSDGVVIEGTTDPDEDPEELATSADVITWASETVTVTPDIHRDATFAATTESRGATKPWPQSKGVATVEPDFNATGSDDEGDVKATEITVTVTAENGYDDTDYTYMVYRAAPVGNTLTASDFSVEAPSGGEIREDLGIVDQFTINVAEAATELDFTVTLEDSDKQALKVEMGGDEVDASDRKRTDGAHESRYELTFAASRAITVDLTVTSEDEVDQLYQLVVRRGSAPGNNPATGKPTISGTAQVGETLTADASGIADADGLGTFEYQWISNDGSADSDISGATSMTYDPVAGDVGNTLKVEVSFTDGAGFAEAVTSDATAAVEAARTPNTPAAGAVTITGTAKVGETLTADVTGITDADGITDATFRYQWSSNDGDADSDISGATSATYDPVAGDVGNTLKVTVRFTDDAGNGEMLTSDATDAVAAADDVPSAPQRLAVTSPASGQLTVSWRAPADEGALGIAGYEYRVAPTQTWTQAGSDASTRSQNITTGLSDGREATIFVRAFGTDAESANVPGAEGSISGTPRPVVTVAAPASTTLTEKDDAETTAVTENETTVSIGLGVSVTSTRVTLMLYAGDAAADPEVAFDKATIVGGSTITFGPGETSKEVTIRASDNPDDDATDPQFRVAATVAEDEAEDREAVVGTDAVTITDDDFKPAEVQGVTATVGDAMLTVTWTDLPDLLDDGSNNDSSKGNGTGFTYQYRYKITSATDDSAWSDWAATTHSDDGIEITSLTNGVGYSIEVRGTSSAGDGDAGTATGTPTGG